MTPPASVATGSEAVDSLSALHEPKVASGEVAWARHRELAVAWAAASPWVLAEDDGDVLVVLDGRLHNLSSPSIGVAKLLVERYRARGDQVAEGLLGDFVLIVLDRATSSLLVARDPLGVRPWYQANAGTRHAAASDMATLASLPWVDTTVNEHIAIEYLATTSESRGETFLRGIRTLPPGHTWRAAGGRSRTLAHHRWDVPVERDISWEDAAERCRALLAQAVECRLAPTAPATSELSGGLDSSSVVGTAMQLGRPDLVVGRLLFDGPRADEREYSDAVIRHWGLRSVSEPPWIPAPGESEELTRELCAPPPDPHFTMFTSLHRALMAEGRRSSLTGLGGDDAFVRSGIGSRVVSAVQLRQGAVLRDFARAAASNPGRSWADLLRPTLHHLARWRGRRLPGWVSADAATFAGLPRLFRARPDRLTGIAAVDERLGNLTSGHIAWVLETSAIVADRLGRRYSHPFLDPRFVRATYGLDPSWSTRGGHTRALQVAAYQDRLPASVAQRRSKADFSEVFWPQLLNAQLLAEVRTGPLAELGWLDQEGFGVLVRNAKNGRANAAIPLSRCVNLDRWLRSGDR